MKKIILAGIIPAVALTLILTACGDKGVPPGQDLPYSTLEITAGNNQVSTAGSLLIDSLGVRVMSSVGSPVSGDTVRFTQISHRDGGQLIYEKWVTDAQGYAHTRFRLDTLVGVDTIMASSDAAGDTNAVFFEMTVTPLRGRNLVNIWPTIQSIPSTIAGEPLAQPVVVEVTDKYGNAAPGERVFFETFNRNVVGTDSTASHPYETESAMTASDSNGLASGVWTLSINPFPIYPAIRQLRVFFSRFDSTSGTTIADTVNIGAMAQDPGVLNYYDDIRPIFADNCFQCHGPDADGYRVDYYFMLEANGNMIPGDTNSLLLTNSNPDNHIYGNVNAVEEDKIIRWVVTNAAAPGSSGLNNYTADMKSIIDASCVTCHNDATPPNNYSMTSHLAIRGDGSDAIPNAIPGADSSLVVQKMLERHNWSSLDPDSVTAAVLADSIIV